MTIKTASKLQVGDRVSNKRKPKAYGVVTAIYPDDKKIAVEWPSYGLTTVCKPSEVERVK